MIVIHTRSLSSYELPVFDFLSLKKRRQLRGKEFGDVGPEGGRLGEEAGFGGVGDLVVQEGDETAHLGDSALVEGGVGTGTGTFGMLFEVLNTCVRRQNEVWSNRKCK